MAASTLLLTLTGWAVTARIVEPRTARLTLEMPSAQLITQSPGHAMRNALIALALTAALFGVLIAVPGAPLHGHGTRFARWVEAVVPMLFILFIVPGIVFGFTSGSFRSHRDVADAMGRTLAELGPYIVLAFFAAQFIEAFNYSHLGEMLAITGGTLLTKLALPVWALIAIFIGVVMFGNLLVGSASAKYAFFAPVFVPMFMYVGISPELTQAAYRVGDSITNVITPLNPYMVIIVALVQRYLPAAGLGTVVALMLPYALVFAVVWILALLAWITLGIPLGPGGGLVYG
jgi:aminobenzoyl-glutamate transport protein